MELNTDPKSIIEELKEAGEELKKASPSKFGDDEKAPPFKSRTSPAAPTAKEEEADLLAKIGKYQDEITQELSALERTYQQVRAIAEKLEARIELLKKLQAKSTEINKELKQLEGQMVLAKKENHSLLLEEIKIKLGKENE